MFCKTLKYAATTASMVIYAAPGSAAESYFPECFAPWSSETAQLPVEPREGPYRIALVNGFAGNDWRIQMIRAAESFAARPEIAAKLEEFAAVSVGDDVAAQISAIENYVAAGYDAVAFIAVNPEAFDSVIRRANREGTLLVSFDNTVNNPDHLIIDISHYDTGATKAQAIVDANAANGVTDGKVLWVRGLPGASADAQKHDGFMDVMNGTDFEVVEVVGNWDTGTAQKVTADAIAAHGTFVGAAVQYGAQGGIQAFLDAGHEPIPFGSDPGNGAVRLLAENDFTGVSVGSSPSISAVAIQGAISALEGKAMPQHVKLPQPIAASDNWSDGQGYYSALPATFDTATGFKECGIDFSPDELTGN